MNISYTSIHLDATSTIRRGGSDNHLTLYIEPGASQVGASLGLVFGFANGHRENADFLRRLAATINDLARECATKADVEMLARKLQEPTPAETYECQHCDAKLGIAGEHSGSEEDYAADDYFRDEIERHESGACVNAEATR